MKALLASCSCKELLLDLICEGPTAESGAACFSHHAVVIFVFVRRPCIVVIVSETLPKSNPLALLCSALTLITTLGFGIRGKKVLFLRFQLTNSQTAKTPRNRLKTVWTKYGQEEAE